LHRITADVPPLGCRKPLHGLDQHRQPEGLTSSGSPQLWQLVHRLSFSLHTQSTPLPIPIQPTGSWRPCRKRNRQDVTCFTGQPAAAALNLRYGRKNPSISVRPRCGHPGRLRLDCRRQRSGHFCADLPHPHLTSAPGLATSPLPENGSARRSKGSATRKIRRESSISRDGGRKKPSS